MGLYLLLLLLFLLVHVYCKSDIQIGYKVSISVPTEYKEGFIGRAFLMETNEMEPNFKTALSVEAEPINGIGNYSCSLQVFLGDVKLKGGGLGWRTATFGQGVQRMQILGTGNLVLLDAFNHIKWQSFNFPTDVILWGQRLNVATLLTSFPTNSTAFYSFEIQQNKIGLYLNLGNWNYSYWEFKTSNNTNITFLQLASKGLELFNDRNHKIAQISNNIQIHKPLRFLALSNKTGNLGLYFYSPEKGNFEAAFQALNTSCDLPLACKPYDICTLSNTCSCVRFLNKGGDCGEGYSGDFCGGEVGEMLELGGVATVLMPPAPSKINITKEACANLCIQDCKCVAALYYSSRESCFLYGMAMGAKQVERGSGMSYMVKIPKGSRDVATRKSGLKKWIMIMVGVIDAFIILLFLGCFGYYLLHKLLIY
ncbi:G-type lectin S-receptor-like serine/threonine-protein kinase At5g35370 isoform X2 [Euphorbia lathyris]|uniref:G-type lectin S-receptor-like serine/threonine-protein kinase At5g35370 isoform X2 n=1 Tax=Euphorbia lathyris TaxID=212925 RepID=UPI003313BF16